MIGKIRTEKFHHLETYRQLTSRAWNAHSQPDSGAVVNTGFTRVMRWTRLIWYRAPESGPGWILLHTLKRTHYLANFVEPFWGNLRV